MILKVDFQENSKDINMDFGTAPKEINVGFGEVVEVSRGGVDFTVDETLKLENGILSVNTAKSVGDNNTLPITAAAVQTAVGNIEILLSTI